MCLVVGRPLRASLQRDGHQQHLRVSLLDSDRQKLAADLHGGPVVPAVETGLGPAQGPERRHVGQTALHGRSHLPEWERYDLKSEPKVRPWSSPNGQSLRSGRVGRFFGY